jgi:hypothetical protein
MTNRPPLNPPETCKTGSRLYVKYLIAKRDKANNEARALTDFIYHQEECELCQAMQIWIWEQKKLTPEKE